MLKFKNLFGGSAKNLNDLIKYPDGKRYYRETHSIRRNHVHPDALKVIHRLVKNNYKAYLVGGSIRDLLLKRRPKDFDIVTNATPNNIKALFANSRIIGRRFKLVHVIFKGGKVIEVATFRSFPTHRLTKDGGSKTDDVYLKKDNIFGEPKEDAARRDFTLNALYFDPRNEAIIDFVGGFEDLLNNQIKVIGDPEVSFREDPVRMIRAVKFATLLGMELDRKTIMAIKKCRNEIKRVPPARILEELNKIFRTRRSYLILKKLADVRLFDVLFPESFSSAKKTSGWPEAFGKSYMGRHLAAADQIMGERDEVSSTLFIGLIFSEIFKDILSGKVKENIMESVREKMEPFAKRMEISKREQDRFVHIFANVHRFSAPLVRNHKLDLFRKKEFFYDAFILFKVTSMANDDSDALQKVFSWEVGLQIRPFENKPLAKVSKHASGKARPDVVETMPMPKAARPKKSRPKRARKKSAAPKKKQNRRKP